MNTDASTDVSTDAYDVSMGSIEKEMKI